MDSFFENLNRFTPPKQKTPGDKGWRKEYQDKATFEKLRFVSPAFAFAGIGAGVLWFSTRHWLAYTGCLILSAAQIVLALCFPVYFTLYLPKGKKKQNVWNLDLSLWCSGIWLMFGTAARSNDFSALRWILPLSIAASVLIWWRIRDLHGEAWGFPSCLLLCVVVLLLVSEQVNVVYDTTPGESWVVEVEDLQYHRGRKSSSYYCVVTLSDGTTEKIRIDKSLYRQLEEGDLVRVELNVGALGMEYTQVYRMK